jgi:hypothetical protein
VAEQSAVNRLAAGSNPARGAIPSSRRPNVYRSRCIFLFIGAVCAIILTACEYYYGARRTVQLTAPLPDNCILQSLSSIDEIEPGSIRQTQWKDGQKNFYWFARKNGTYTSGVVSLSSETTGGVMMTLESGLMNNPEEENLQYGRNVLDLVYNNLIKFCPNVPDESLVIEQCYRTLGSSKCQVASKSVTMTDSF